MRSVLPAPRAAAHRRSRTILIGKPAAGSVLDPALPQPGPDSTARALAWPVPPASRGATPPNVHPHRRGLRLGPRYSPPDGCNPGLPRPLPPSPSACNGPTSTHHHRYHRLHPYPPTNSPPLSSEQAAGLSYRLPLTAYRFRAAALGTRHLALRHSHSATRPTWDAPSRPFQALQRWSPSPSDALGEHSDRALSTQRSRNYIWPWHQSAKHSGGEVTANWQACSVRRAGVTACVALGAQPCCGEH